MHGETSLVVLRVDCITENFGRAERWCLGDMGGVGYCAELSRQKLLVNSYLTVGEHYGIRAHHYTNMGYIWRAAAEMPPIRRRKKIGKKLICSFAKTNVKILYIFSRK